MTSDFSAIAHHICQQNCVFTNGLARASIPQQKAVGAFAEGLELHGNRH
jgi:hypothetical protein